MPLETINELAENTGVDLKLQPADKEVLRKDEDFVKEMFKRRDVHFKGFVLADASGEFLFKNSLQYGGKSLYKWSEDKIWKVLQEKCVTLGIIRAGESVKETLL